jgi:hypothetical protein
MAPIVPLAEKKKSFGSFRNTKKFLLAYGSRMLSLNPRVIGYRK